MGKETQLVGTSVGRTAKLSVVTVFVSLLLAAHAGAEAMLPRTIEEPYTGASSFSVPYLEVHSQCTTVNNDHYGGVCFKPRQGERFVTIEVADDSGLPAGFSVGQGNRFLGSFCEETDSPLRIRPKKIVSITMIVAGCGGTSIPTRGVVRATLSATR